jgi:hypothetical protein
MRLRRVNGPNFTWPLMQFSGVIPESWLTLSGAVYGGQPLPLRTREDLLTPVRADWRETIATARANAAGRSRRLRMVKV